MNRIFGQCRLCSQENDQKNENPSLVVIANSEYIGNLEERNILRYHILDSLLKGHILESLLF